MAVALDDMNDILITYWERLNGGQKEKVIDYIEYLLDEIHPISIDQYNQELELGQAEVEAGNFYTHEEVVKMLEEEGK